MRRDGTEQEALLIAASPTSQIQSSSNSIVFCLVLIHNYLNKQILKNAFLSLILFKYVFMCYRKKERKEQKHRFLCLLVLEQAKWARACA